MIKLTFRIWILIIVLILAVLMISPSFETGLEIKSVDKNSPAFESGLRSGMKIQEINSQKIETMLQFTEFASTIVSDSRINILADKNSFVFIGNISSITLSEIPNTNIKTGLDLSGGARALVKAVNVSLSDSEMADLVSITSERLNAFGLADVNIRSVKDLQGNNYMLIEIADASTEDIKEIVGKQGKFEAKIGNKTVFIGGEKDISDVCRSGSCSGITGCSQVIDGYACNFRFAVYLREEAAQKHAEITKNLSIDDTGIYLSEKLYLFVDDVEVDSLLIN